MSTCTCHTTGCVNNSIGIDMELVVDLDGTPTPVEAVFCGGCSTQITDISDDSGSGSDSTSDTGSESTS